ncbi:MAG: ferredoxin [Acidobacteria bacterium]|nr:MAG: ferredoxin [Acidobacteriota bacterium]
MTLLLPEEERTIQVGADEHIWDAALKAGIKLPALCHQGRCLTCAGRLVDGGEVDQSDSISYFPRKPCSPLRILTNQQDEMRRDRRQHGLPAPYS